MSASLSGVRVSQLVILLSLWAAIPAAVGAQASPDSAAQSSNRSDSSSLGYGDSTAKAAIDTSAVAADDSSMAPRHLPTPDESRSTQVIVPVDSTLAVACRALAPGARAPALLLVTFRAGSTDREQAQVAASVGGTLAGTAMTDERYVQVSAGAASVRTAADSLIRSALVSQVSETTCPSLEAAP
jgi:hypothetical protein